MKRLTLLITLIILFLGVAGCRNAREEQRSTFFSHFSIGEIIARHEKYLLPESRTLGGTEAGPEAPPFQKHEEMIVQIDPANAPRFMEAIKTDIQETIRDSDSTIEGQGGSFQDPVKGQADIDYISFRYSQGKASGIINLYGIRGEGTNYVIIVILTES
jgi:hypothetical protein